jgi:methylated-DNA-[protein]-cysteine S-methyltransferase
MRTLLTAEVETPIGTLRCAVHEGRLRALEFAERWPLRLAWLERRIEPMIARLDPDPAGVVARIREYFAGRLDALSDVPTELLGTPFQIRVWEALRKIAPGRTLSYGELARAVRRPDAARAVGAANGANPIAIVVPCHRVVGADGGLTGYAGGLERKRWLLAHEARHAGKSAGRWDRAGASTVHPVESSPSPVRTQPTIASAAAMAPSESSSYSTDGTKSSSP